MRTKMDNISPMKRGYLAIALTSIFTIAPMIQAEEVDVSVNEADIIRPVKLMQVGNSAAHSNKTFPAKVAANQQVDLAFRINGKLTHLDLLAGQQIQKGDLLAQLDDRDAKNALLNAQANHQLAQVNFARKEKLLAKRQIPTSDFDSAKAELQSTLATLNSAKDQLSYTTLRAPFSGIVAKVYIENYQMLQASQVVVTLQDKKQFDITFNVPESYLFNMKNLNLKKNQEEYSIKFNGCDNYFQATFKEMNTIINNGSQTYQIVLSFTPPANLSILPGMSVNVSVNESTNTLPKPILPLTAIVHDEQTQQDYVWVYQAQTQTLKKSVVVLGDIRTEGTEILSGLTIGDQVVAAGAHAIESEMKVSPLHWERGV
jgi:RND family efflux transporter MFP subunit